MTSYLQNWLPSSVAAFFPLSTTSDQPKPPIELTISPPHTDDEDEDTETEADPNDDTPPVFPSINSAQRISSTTAASSAKSSLNQLPKVLKGTQLMPPPPVPALASRIPGVPTDRTPTFLPAPSSSPGLLRPLQTTKKPTVRSKGQSRKVALAPGHSPLDWAALKSSGKDLRGIDTLSRIPPSVLKLHNKKDDAWVAIHGKVYNVTPYLPFHPGGENELMRAAGRDGTKLFALTHAWVNVDFMLDECLVGFLVSESSS